MGGATNIRRFLGLARDQGVRSAGLVDEAEAHFFARALGVAIDELESRGFFTCTPDLEVELIRALGADAVRTVIAERGDLRSWETFIHQPFQRGRSEEQRLRRFLGTTSGRKEEYARALADRLDPVAIPAPLARLLEWACGDSKPSG